jgi:hypothetical protein
VIAPMIGMMMSETSESTILPKAAPMITATARSTTLPFIAKSRNSLSMCQSSSPGRPLGASGDAMLSDAWTLEKHAHVARFGDCDGALAEPANDAIFGQNRDHWSK